VYDYVKSEEAHKVTVVRGRKWRLSSVSTWTRDKLLDVVIE